MIADEIANQLDQISTVTDFAFRSAGITDMWRAAGVGIESVDPILRFMEKHPAIDYGAPGPLVHFVEGFYGNGYEEKLIESIKRKPTATTLGMLNAIINGTKSTVSKRCYVAELRAAQIHPLADENARIMAERFLRNHR